MRLVTFPKGTMKSLVVGTEVVGTEVSQNNATAMFSVAKVLDGEVVGGTLDVQEVKRLGKCPTALYPSIGGRRLF